MLGLSILGLSQNQSDYCNLDPVILNYLIIVNPNCLIWMLLLLLLFCFFFWYIPVHLIIHVYFLIFITYMFINLLILWQFTFNFYFAVLNFNIVAGFWWLHNFLYNICYIADLQDNCTYILYIIEWWLWLSEKSVLIQWILLLIVFYVSIVW